jgi:hypothetical protein
MRSITIFTSAFFYYAATAGASQPAKVELHGVPRSAVALRTVQKGRKANLKGLASLVQPTHEKDVHVVVKVGSSKLLFNGTSLKTENTKVKKDADNSDRRLGQKGSIRGGNTKDSVQRERSLQDLTKNIAFASDMAMPIHRQGMLGKTSGGSNRRLEDIPCSEMADGSLSCRLDDYPGEDFYVVFSCPASASTLLDCSTCSIFTDDNAYQCNSCTVCSDTVAYDCSNIGEGSCVIADCDGNCEESTPTPTDPNPPDPSCTTECNKEADCCEGYICTFYGDGDQPLCILQNIGGDTLCNEDADCKEGYYCGYYDGVSVAFCIKKWW